MEQTLTLTFMSGSRDGEVVQFTTTGTTESISIGRNTPCELVISDDPDMSRRHARIYWSGASWILEDLNSSNGTFIGEFQTARRLSGSAAINGGEIFRVGLTRLRLAVAKNESATAAGAAVAGATKHA